MQINHKKVRKLILCLILVLILTACGTSEEPTSTESNGSTETMEAESVSDLTQIEKSTKPTIELAAGFDEEFVIRLGEELYVGREDIKIKLEEASYDENMQNVFIRYSLTIGDSVYEGYGNRKEEEDGYFLQDVFTENRLCYISGGKDGSVTLMLTSGTKVKKPITLSGNAEDEYVTTEPEYVVSEDFILFLDENVKVYGNTMELISTIFDLVENETGLKFENESKYGAYRDSLLYWVFGNEVFAGVDPNMEKFHIYVVPFEKSVACSLTHSIVLNPEDLEIAAGEGWTVVHELVHSAQSANGVMMNSVMNEGFATYITGQITAKDEVIPFNFDANLNYSGYQIQITAANAEAEFLAEYEDGWNYYLYGYRFVTFLFETYGNDVYLNILNDATESVSEGYFTIEKEELPPIIKANTSEDVFVRFAEWLQQNKDRFY